MIRKHTNKWMQEKMNNVEVRYDNQENNKKAEWISNVEKELEGLEEGTKAEIHIDLHRTALKNIKFETPGHNGIKGFWFKKFHTIHDRLALEINGCLQEVDVPEWVTKEAGHNWSKKTPSKKPPQTATDI